MVGLRRTRAWLSPLLLLLATLALLLQPIQVAAAATRLSLEAYQSRLRDSVAQLERVQERLTAGGRATEVGANLRQVASELGGRWEIETDSGPLLADLTHLGQLIEEAVTQPEQHLPAALRLAENHLIAAEALSSTQAILLPAARETLEDALERTTALSARERIQRWFNRLLGRQLERVPDPKLPSWSSWVAGGLGAVALLWIGYSLYRILGAHGSSPETILRADGRKADGRPPTPAELLQMASTLSAEGRYLEAVRHAHLALLQHYDQLGLIRYQPAQTNREHELQLRRRLPELARSLRQLNDLVDDRLYSGQGASEADYIRTEGLVQQLWREGDATSRHVETIPGRSSSALSP